MKCACVCDDGTETFKDVCGAHQHLIQRRIASYREAMDAEREVQNILAEPRPQLWFESRRIKNEEKALHLSKITAILAAGLIGKNDVDLNSELPFILNSAAKLIELAERRCT